MTVRMARSGTFPPAFEGIEEPIIVNRFSPKITYLSGKILTVSGICGKAGYSCGKGEERRIFMELDQILQLLKAKTEVKQIGRAHV